jgi:hypothetical protein
MSEHMTDWLGAYLDGELKGTRFHQVQSHLNECSQCRAELDSLKGLSALLHAAPFPEFTPPERFASQVGLHLPRELPKPVKRDAFEIGWWLIPVCLLLLWTLTNTSAIVDGALRAANSIGLLNDVPAWLVEGPREATWSMTLGRFGLIKGQGLEWAVLVESFTKNELPQIVWQASIALLYLSWIAIWWARQQSRSRSLPALKKSV